MLRIKTIRLKLTLWYTLWILLISIFFILSLNLMIHRVYQKQKKADEMRPRNPYQEARFEKMTDDQKNHFQSLRNEDLRRVRNLSIISLIPLTVLSIGGGYLVAGRMLSPLNELNRNIKNINAERLGETIKIEDVEEEIAELIESFNKMSGRLGHSFSLQKQFIEDASHEIKTPLASIKTNLEAFDKKDDKFIKNSLNSVDFMNKLVEDLLLLSLVEKQVHMKKVELKEVFNKAVDELSDFAKNHNIKLVKRIELNNSIMVIGNATLLQRAIMNLIENAIKYSNKGSKVECRLSKIENHLVVSIKDTGIGISEENLEYIFDRFYRVDKSRSRKTGGSGLGLSIVKKIVTLHKGAVKVNSIEGTGTEFKIVLPL